MSRPGCLPYVYTTMLGSTPIVRFLKMPPLHSTNRTNHL